MMWSREMSHLSKISVSIFLHRCLTTLKCFILMQTPFQLDIWLQSYAGFDNAENNIKQRNLNPVFANISKTTSPISNSFLSQMTKTCALSLPFTFSFATIYWRKLMVELYFPVSVSHPCKQLQSLGLMVTLGCIN